MNIRNFTKIFLLECSSCIAALFLLYGSFANASCEISGVPRSTAFQKSTEKNPLYTIPAKNGVVSCEINYSSDGVVALEYNFHNGGWLKAISDSQIEYVELNAYFDLKEDPKTVLSEAEHIAFGYCGIDWNHPENGNVFHGDTCNCQAQIHRNGVHTGLTLKSAC